MSQRRGAEEAPADAGASGARPEPATPLELPALPERPLVSVLVPNKDYARFLPEALGSLISQTYDRWEAVVCDDGSSDGSVEVIEEAMREEPRLRLVRHESPQGQAAAFNAAFERATGDIVCFLDADDTFEPDKLARVVEAFSGRGADAGLLIHPLMMFGAQGPIQRIPALSAMEEGWLEPTLLRRGGRWRWVPTSGVTLRREVADLVLPMPVKGLRISADTYFLVLAPMLTRVVVVDRVLGGYRRHDANGFARGRLDAERARRAAENLRIVTDEVNLRLEGLNRSADLRIDRNLKYGELMFQAALLEGRTSRRVLARRCSGLLGSFLRDDLYGVTQKAWAVVLYAVAVVLPTNARDRWLSWSLSGSRAKERIRRVLGARRVRSTA